jgi:hypothetical protein
MSRTPQETIDREIAESLRPSLKELGFYEEKTWNNSISFRTQINVTQAQHFSYGITANITIRSNAMVLHSAYGSWTIEYNDPDFMIKITEFSQKGMLWHP